MSYFDYHAHNRKRIANGELMGAEIVKDYNKQGERLVLYFSTEPIMRPIKPERYSEYEQYLK